MQTTVLDVLAEAQGALEKATFQERDAREWVVFLKGAKAPAGEIQKAAARVAAAEQAVAERTANLNRLQEAERLLQRLPEEAAALGRETEGIAAALADGVGDLLLKCKELQRLLVAYSGISGTYMAAQRSLPGCGQERTLPGGPAGILAPNWTGRDCLGYLFRLAGGPMLQGREFSADRLAKLLH